MLGGKNSTAIPIVIYLDSDDKITHAHHHFLCPNTHSIFLTCEKQEILESLSVFSLVRGNYDQDLSFQHCQSNNWIKSSSLFDMQIPNVVLSSSMFLCRETKEKNISSQTCAPSLYILMVTALSDEALLCLFLLPEACQEYG
jgi:hypothetical protein